MTAGLDFANLAAVLGASEEDISLVGHGIPCVDVPAARWAEVLLCCRDDLGANFFDWLSAVDEPGHQAIDLLVHLVRCVEVSPSGPEHATPRTLLKIMVRTRLFADNPQIPSVTQIWPGAAWHERETHEMFGVNFTDFSDGTGLGLRPLLLPDGFSGNPLKKSFQLAARASKPWPGAKEPGEGAAGAPSRRKILPPGVPDPAWGPRKLTGAAGLDRGTQPADLPSSAPATSGQDAPSAPRPGNCDG